MRDAYPRQFILGHSVLSDRSQGAQCEGSVGCIAELRDGAVFECVAGCAEEENICACGGGVDFGENGGRVERGVSEEEMDVVVGEVDAAWVGGGVEVWWDGFGCYCRCYGGGDGGVDGLIRGGGGCCCCFGCC